MQNDMHQCRMSKKLEIRRQAKELIHGTPNPTCDITEQFGKFDYHFNISNATKYTYWVKFNTGDVKTKEHDEFIKAINQTHNEHEASRIRYSFA